MKFEDISISEKIKKGLREMGFEDMTPIQEQAIPLFLEGRDVLGIARTGTGKTGAFGIPMIERIDGKNKSVQGLVLCPTRELALQAAEEISKMAKFVPGVEVLAVYGGTDIERQFRRLKKGVNIIVGTPGRVMDHMRRKTLKLDELKVLVLDEADEMLNMGFREDIEFVCDHIDHEVQTALFSATMADEIREITENYQDNAEYIAVQQEEMTVPEIKQMYYSVKGREKDTSICRLIDYIAPKRALIFCNTKRKVDELTLTLKAKGYSAEALHGDLSQHQRDRVMNLFRQGKLELLLATDVAARGIDVDDVDVVFNYDMPQDMEYYVHRIGRTGRAGKSGRAISLITPRERYKIDSLEEYCNTKIRERNMPTAESALHMKSIRKINDALEFCREFDLEPFMRIVYQICMEEKLDSLQIAAALLRTQLGEIEQAPKQKKNSDTRKSKKSKEKNAQLHEKGEGSKKKKSKGKQSKKNASPSRVKHDKYRDKAQKNRDEKGRGNGRKGSNGKGSNSSAGNRRPDRRRSGSGKK